MISTFTAPNMIFHCMSGPYHPGGGGGSKAYRACSELVLIRYACTYVSYVLHVCMEYSVPKHAHILNIHIYVHQHICTIRNIYGSGSKKRDTLGCLCIYVNPNMYGSRHVSVQILLTFLMNMILKFSRMFSACANRQKKKRCP